MTSRKGYCEKHPDDTVQYCSLCMRELRLAIRKECVDLSDKLEKYREAILGPDAAKKRDDEWP